MIPVCPYCQSLAQLVTGADIYKRRPDLNTLNFWRCQPCDAYVGCHKASSGSDGTKPLGRLATADLRIAKRKAHAAFDPVWQSGAMTRKEAYAWLSEAIGMPPERTHIGEFDVGLCNDVMDACKSRQDKMRPQPSMAITPIPPSVAPPWA